MSGFARPEPSRWHRDHAAAAAGGGAVGGSGQQAHAMPPVPRGQAVPKVCR